MGKIILEVKKISKSYNNGEKDLHVLQDLSLKVCEKEIVTITGKKLFSDNTRLSGCGSNEAQARALPGAPQLRPAAIP